MEADDEKAEREEVEAAPDDPGLKADDDDEHVSGSQPPHPIRTRRRRRLARRFISIPEPPAGEHP